MYQSISRWWNSWSVCSAHIPSAIFQSEHFNLMQRRDPVLFGRLFRRVRAGDKGTDSCSHLTLDLSPWQYAHSHIGDLSRYHTHKCFMFRLWRGCRVRAFSEKKIKGACHSVVFWLWQKGRSALVKHSALCGQLLHSLCSRTELALVYLGPLSLGFWCDWSYWWVLPKQFGLLCYTFTAC